MSVIVAEPKPVLTAACKPATLVAVLREVEVKRAGDLIRFRTCCADPRASK